jgi:GH24 family phage-related lysozyme (muramidase)
MPNHQSLKQLLIENEGNIPHFYLDTVGRVTVGVGHMIPVAAQATGISLQVRVSGLPASSQQIEGEFSRISSQRPAMPAAQYRQFTTLEMTEEVTDALLDADIAAMEAGVRQHFAGYDSYPEPAQDGILDMAFNLGVGGLVSNFPTFKRAAEERNWNTCAAECHRNGISDSRNQKTKQLFLEAASTQAASA